MIGEDCVKADILVNSHFERCLKNRKLLASKKKRKNSTSGNSTVITEGKEFKVSQLSLRERSLPKSFFQPRSSTASLASSTTYSPSSVLSSSSCPASVASSSCTSPVSKSSLSASSSPTSQKYKIRKSVLRRYSTGNTSLLFDSLIQNEKENVLKSNKNNSQLSTHTKKKVIGNTKSGGPKKRNSLSCSPSATSLYFNKTNIKCEPNPNTVLRNRNNNSNNYNNNNSSDSNSSCDYSSYASSPLSPSSPQAGFSPRASGHDPIMTSLAGNAMEVELALEQLQLQQRLQQKELEKTNKQHSHLTKINRNNKGSSNNSNNNVTINSLYKNNMDIDLSSSLPAKSHSNNGNYPQALISSFDEEVTLEGDSSSSSASNDTLSSNLNSSTKHHDNGFARSVSLECNDSMDSFDANDEEDLYILNGRRPRSSTTDSFFNSYNSNFRPCEHNFYEDGLSFSSNTNYLDIASPMEGIFPNLELTNSRHSSSSASSSSLVDCLGSSKMSHFSCTTAAAYTSRNPALSKVQSSPMLTSSKVLSEYSYKMPEIDELLVPGFNSIPWGFETNNFMESLT
eukprot:Awhi_evm1s2751